TQIRKLSVERPKRLGCPKRRSEGRSIQVAQKQQIAAARAHVRHSDRVASKKLALQARVEVVVHRRLEILGNGKRVEWRRAARARSVNRHARLDADVVSAG